MNPRFVSYSDFYEIAPFPGIVGCVDGAHISIIVTTKNEFVLRKPQQFLFGQCPGSW